MGRKRAQMDVTLKLLLEAGEIRPGAAVLQVASREKTRCGDLHADGHISFEGVRHRSLSSFAVAAIRSCGATGRKTANGWQVVNYRGRPLDQYRSEFIEKRSQDSDSTSSRDVDDDEDDERVAAAAAAMKTMTRTVATTTVTKKRRAAQEPEQRQQQQQQLWRHDSGSSGGSVVLRSSESGCSRCSFSDDHKPQPPVQQQRFSPKRRLRPSRSWFDTLPALTAFKQPTSNNNKTTMASTFEQSAESAADATCGMNVKDNNRGHHYHHQCHYLMKNNHTFVDDDHDGGAGEEEDDDQGLAVNMWLKKALNKRHKEECGMS